MKRRLTVSLGNIGRVVGRGEGLGLSQAAGEPTDRGGAR
jgi:hypothetical protein